MVRVVVIRMVGDDDVRFDGHAELLPVGGQDLAVWNTQGRVFRDLSRALRLSGPDVRSPPAR